MEIRDKVALVTGGAHRVGKAIALALARSGAHVAITYNTSSDQARNTLGEVRQSGVRAAAFKCDQQSNVSIEQLFESLQREFDHIDILINSAAIMERQSVLDVTLDDWERVVNTNLRGPFFITQAAAKWMNTAGIEGSMVNIADLSAIHPWPGYITHTISKSGLVAMTQALALALAPSIRVNAVAPGAVMKPQDWDDEQWNKLGTTLPLKRSGSAEDVTQAVLFCLHSDFMTGHTLIVDGGRSLK